MPASVPVRAENVAAEVAAFVAACRQAAVLEPGEEPLDLVAGQYSFGMHGGKVVLEVWSGQRNLVRRLSTVVSRKPGRMEIEVERFGGRTSRIVIFDRARPGAQIVERRGARLILRERLRAFLSRQFTGWRIEEITAEADLEHTLSPAYARAFVRRGGSGWAALAAPADPATADAALTFGIVWLDYLRRRESRTLIEGLCLLLPAGMEGPACLRLAWLNERAARFVVFSYDGDWEEPVEAGGHGNLDTRIGPPGASEEVGLRRIAHRDEDEARLEGQVRAGIEALDAELLPEPVYGQVPAWTAAERGVLDLLAIDRQGRLAVVELKASADPHLPLQALDYWLRVALHNQSGDFTRLGYFPGLAISASLPRLLLVAPALAFHETTETILRYFSSSVSVERLGVRLEWQQELKVMFRLKGARSPH